MVIGLIAGFILGVNLGLLLFSLISIGNKK